MNNLQQIRRKLKLITFDVTGTLLNFKIPVGKQYAEAGSKYNVHVDSDLLNDAFLKSWKHMNETHPNYGYSCNMTWESWWHQLVQRTFVTAAPSMEFDVESSKKISHYLTEVFRESECWELCDGAVDILEDLKMSGMPVGVISNSDPRLEEVLINMKIRDYFNFVIASYTVGVEKPHSEVFKLAMDLFSDKTLKHHEILHIGDSPTLDFQAALNAGWNACLVDPNRTFSILPYSPDRQLKHSSGIYRMTVKNLHELRSVLKGQTSSKK
ncbi:rhythmically expressed gene 2 protein [Bemisia tabaci]|uniref:rhythmically expressed gene 2 protein n=1 Tax=Bemisia tabaci TaxID=7038 RepID=UPI003B280E72